MNCHSNQLQDADNKGVTSSLLFALLSDQKINPYTTTTTTITTTTFFKKL